MIELKYHDSVIKVPDPPVGRIETLYGKDIKPLDDFSSNLLHALDNPIGSEPLSKMIPSDGMITIMIPDRTRNSRLKLLLPEIDQYLKICGVSDDRIRLLICLGTHKSHSREQLRELIGDEYLNRFKLYESDQDDPEAFRKVGTTPMGTDVFYHQIALESNLLIVLGGITFHYFAGYSGGRKSFIPGIARIDTIQKNHSLTYKKVSGKYCRNLNCESGRLDGNPVSEDMEDGLRLMPVPSFLVNIIVNPQSELAAVFAGDVIKAHREGCDAYDKFYSIQLTQKADIILASSGGRPNDINLLQSHKSMINCARAVKPGGTIFLVSRCNEGVSLSGYPEYMKTHSQQDLINRLMDYYEIHGGTVDNLLEITNNYRLFLVSDIDDDTLKALNIRPFRNGIDLWDDVFEGLNSESLCYIMPDASKFLPVYIGDD